MGDGDLEWHSESVSGATVLAATGRVDEATATAFGEGLIKGVVEASSGAARLLAIDLAGIDYMSSRGLRALTLAQRKASELGIGLVLTRPNEIMREILAISRYDKVFRVFDRNEDALAG